MICAGKDGSEKEIRTAGDQYGRERNAFQVIFWAVLPARQLQGMANLTSMGLGDFLHANLAMKDQRYYTGEEIHMGDRVSFGGRASTILFVVDRGEYAPSELAEMRQWWQSDHLSGFMVHQDGGADIFLEEADEDLLFLSRRESSD